MNQIERGQLTGLVLEALSRAHDSSAHLAEDIVHSVEERIRADERKQGADALMGEANKYRHGTETDYRHGIQYAASFLMRKR